jgi:hypothetical protein
MTTERPSWCPHSTCCPVGGASEQKCVGALPAPEPHDGDFNTHRLCLRGARDDGEWTFDLQINRADAWHLWRTLGHVFGLGATSEPQQVSTLDEIEAKWLRNAEFFHSARCMAADPYATYFKIMCEQVVETVRAFRSALPPPPQEPTK